jgi:hypothetical protein
MPVAIGDVKLGPGLMELEELLGPPKYQVNPKTTYDLMELYRESNFTVADMITQGHLDINELDWLHEVCPLKRTDQLHILKRKIHFNKGYAEHVAPGAGSRF